MWRPDGELDAWTCACCPAGDDVKKPDCVPGVDPRTFPGIGGHGGGITPVPSHGGGITPVPSHGGSSGGGSPSHGGSSC